VAVAPNKQNDDLSSSQSSSTSFRLLPFQELRRGTGGGNNRLGQMRVYCFYLLYLNGQSLLKTPLWKRQELLREHFVETAGFAFAQSTPLPPITPTLPAFDEVCVTNALKESVDGGAEGLMVKLTRKCKNDNADHDDDDRDDNSTSNGSALVFYESGARSREWSK
jgi:ATP-dependent DNA ligase